MRSLFYVCLKFFTITKINVYICWKFFIIKKISACVEGSVTEGRRARAAVRGQTESTCAKTCPSCSGGSEPESPAVTPRARPVRSVGV